MKPLFVTTGRVLHYPLRYCLDPDGNDLVLLTGAVGEGCVTPSGVAGRTRQGGGRAGCSTVSPSSPAADAAVPDVWARTAAAAGPDRDVGSNT
jgi:hypothetical protein